jgi:type IV secretory pathway VirB10-like protein
VLEDIAAKYYAHPQPAPAPVLYGGLEQTAPVAQTPIPHSLSEPQNAEQQQVTQAGSRRAQTSPGMLQYTQAKSQTGELLADNVRAEDREAEGAQTGRRKDHNHSYIKTPLTNLL